MNGKTQIQKGLNISKIIENPVIGKPLRYDLHGERSVRIGHYRLIYSIKNNMLFLLRLEHKKEAYR